MPDDLFGADLPTRLREAAMRFPHDAGHRRLLLEAAGEIDYAAPLVACLSVNDVRNEPTWRETPPNRG